jgi:hypothetical protein
MAIIYYLDQVTKVSYRTELVNDLLSPAASAFAHGKPRSPVPGLRDRAAPLLELALGRPDQVAAARLLQPRHVLRARRPAVHHPNPVRDPVARLHRLHDLLDRGHVGAIARKDLVAQRHPFARDHQRDAHLLAVRPVVPAVAALRQGIALCQALEVAARHVVEQQSKWSESLSRGKRTS